MKNLPLNGRIARKAPGVQIWVVIKISLIFWWQFSIMPGGVTFMQWRHFLTFYWLGLLFFLRQVFSYLIQIYMLKLEFVVYSFRPNEVFHEGFFSKCDQIRSFLQIWSYFLKKSLMKNFIFCVQRLLFITNAAKYWKTLKQMGSSSRRCIKILNARKIVLLIPKKLSWRPPICTFVLTLTSSGNELTSRLNNLKKYERNLGRCYV